jgi:hypothetical protein
MKILPVNIKSLAGSVATLANWLTAWGITMTASLMLSWSSGGTSLPELDACPFPHARAATLVLITRLPLIRNLRYLCRSMYHDPRLRVPVRAGDQGEDVRGDRILVPLK